MIIAAREGHHEICEVLLAHATDTQALLEQQDKEGCTALMVAAREGYHEVCEVLLAHTTNMQALLTQKNSNGDTASMYARKNEHASIVTLLERSHAQ